jgi:YgiT-type zinc finger domain-containing protein
MNCILCKQGKTCPGFATVTLQQDETTVILKQVPADICENRGEYYLSSEITARVMQRAEAAVKMGAEIEIVKFAA